MRLQGAEWVPSWGVVTTLAKTVIAARWRTRTRPIKEEGFAEFRAVSESLTALLVLLVQI